MWDLIDQFLIIAYLFTMNIILLMFLNRKRVGLRLRQTHPPNSWQFIWTKEAYFHF